MFLQVQNSDHKSNILELIVLLKNFIKDDILFSDFYQGKKEQTVIQNLLNK